MVVPYSVFASHFCVVCLSNKPKNIVVKQAHLMVEMTKNQNLLYIEIKKYIESFTKILYISPYEINF